MYTHAHFGIFKSSYREGPDGLIALSEAKEMSLSTLKLKKIALY